MKLQSRCSVEPLGTLDPSTDSSLEVRLLVFHPTPDVICLRPYEVVYVYDERRLVNGRPYTRV